MADFWVKHTQMWLNNTFGNDKNWIRLAENGKTGTNTMKGLIRAFQIHNNISPSTGTVGPITLKKFKELATIKKMQPNDKADINVFIVQGALFCKGYNAGGLTGIFYNAGIRAIKEMQSDASINVTGQIDWKEWSSLLSMNWFKLVSNGNPIVRKIQRQLNNEFSNEIGVGPCDGIVSRHTALSLIAAVQVAEGLSVVNDLNQVNFGKTTTKKFPELKFNQNDEYHKKFNRILQYGLYFNGFDPMGFDGIFDSATYTSVASFQKKYGLLNINLVTPGVVNAATMNSLLTSKGDPERRAYACDCATILSKAQALDLKKSGFTHVGRYLTGSVGSGASERSKALSTNEIEIIKEVGLSLFPIYQDGGYYEKYFHNSNRGFFDAKAAILAAKNLGIKANTTIYFAVDFDCFGYQIDKYIIPYFENINMAFNFGLINTKNYKVGIYAPRYVCTKIYKKNLASTSFISDMSTGFSGNLGFPLPENWAFDQFNELTFTSHPSFAIDKDAYSGKDTGCNTFDKVPKKTSEEIKKEITNSLVETAREHYLYSALKPTGYLDKVLNLKINFEGKPVTLAYITTPKADIKLDLKVSSKFRTPGTSADSAITIELNKDKELSTSFKNKIGEITQNIDGLKETKSIKDLICKMAVSVGSGDIAFESELINPKQLKVAIQIADNKIPVKLSNTTEIFISLEATITLKNNQNFDEDKFSLYSEPSIGTIIMIILYIVYGSKLKLVSKIWEILQGLTLIPSL